HICCHIPVKSLRCLLLCFLRPMWGLMRANSSAWLQIHLCVLLWGFTAILGRLITLPVLALVLWRMFLVTCALLLLPKVWRALRRLSGRHLLAIIGVGVVVALHWLGFYAAVKLSNASVAATCMALIPIFLCVIEPLVTGRRFQPRELLFGLLVLPGIMLVVGGTPSDMNADRKSTRLNSSHVKISYAVFCLKKK